MITISYDHFIGRFPYFSGKSTNESVQGSYMTIPEGFRLGASGLPLSDQISVVYLATAHQEYLNLNPDLAGKANLTSATEGSVSAGWDLSIYSSPWQRWLSMSPYGLQLMALLAMVQPPIAGKPCNSYPYYQGGFYGW